MLFSLTTQDITTICNTVLGALTLIGSIVATIFGYLAKRSANRAEDHSLANTAKIDDNTALTAKSAKETKAAIAEVKQQTNGLTTALVQATGKAAFSAGQNDEKAAEAGRRIAEHDKHG